MSKEDLLVNQENEIDTIFVEQDEVLSKYTLIPNALIRDKTISPNCRWLLIYLLSNDEKNWVIKRSQICNHVKGFMGKNKVIAVLNEAIEAGYMKREHVKIPQPNGKGWLTGYKYLLSRTPRFKKCLREPCFREPDHRAPENSDAKEVLSKEIPIKEKETSLEVPDVPVEISPQKKLKKAKDFSPEVIALTDRIIACLQNNSDDYRKPKNISHYLEEAKSLLEEDLREPDRIIEVLEYGVLDTEKRDKFNGWSCVLYSRNPVKSLRNSFSSIAQQMKSKPKQAARKFAPCSNNAEALRIAQEMTRNAL